MKVFCGDCVKDKKRVEMYIAFARPKASTYVCPKCDKATVLDCYDEGPFNVRAT